MFTYRIIVEHVSITNRETSVRSLNAISVSLGDASQCIRGLGQCLFRESLRPFPAGPALQILAVYYRAHL